MTPTHKTLIVMTRLPRVGKNKTRLIPALGPAGATHMHEKLARHAIATASAFASANSVNLTIRLEGGTPDQGQQWLGKCDCREQAPGDLGQRMHHACETAFQENASQTVVIGTDCPSITEETLSQAFHHLESHDITYGPAADGGYYLIGMRSPPIHVFRNIDWGQSTVLEQSLRAARKDNLNVKLLPTLPDVDNPEDIEAGLQAIQLSERICAIVLPQTQNNSSQQPPTLLNHTDIDEWIVAPENKEHLPNDIPKRENVKLLHPEKNGNSYILQVSSAATCNYLLLLTAKTVLPNNFKQTIINTLAKPEVVAGMFLHQNNSENQAPYTLFLRKSILTRLGCNLDEQALLKHLQTFGEIEVHQTSQTPPPPGHS